MTLYAIMDLPQAKVRDIIIFQKLQVGLGNAPLYLSTYSQHWSRLLHLTIGASKTPIERTPYSLCFMAFTKTLSHLRGRTG